MRRCRVRRRVAGVAVETHIWFLEEWRADEVGMLGVCSTRRTSRTARFLDQQTASANVPTAPSLAATDLPVWDDAKLPDSPRRRRRPPDMVYYGRGGNFSWDVDLQVRKDYGTAQPARSRKYDGRRRRRFETYGAEDDDLEWETDRAMVTTLELRVVSDRTFYNYTTGNATHKERRAMAMRLNISNPRTIEWHKPMFVPGAIANVGSA